MRPRFLYFFALAIQLLALGAMLFFTIKNGLDPILITGDSGSYTVTAQNLFEQGSFSYAKQAPYVPDAVRTPGYPFFIGLIWIVLGKSWLAVIVIQTLLLALAPPLLYLIGRRMNERAAFIAAAIFAIEPTRIFYSNVIMSDGLFTLGLLVTIYLFLEWLKEAKRAHMFAIGVSIGILTLIRPIAMLFWIPMLIPLWLTANPWKKNIIASAFVLFGFAISIAPWSARNFVHFGSWQLSPIGSYSFAYANASLFYQHRTGKPLDDIRREFKETFPPNTPGEEEVSLKNMHVYKSVTERAIGDQWVRYGIFHTIKSVPLFITDSFRTPLQLTGIIPVDAPVPNFSSSILNGTFPYEWNTYRKTQPLPAFALVIGMLFWIFAWMLGAWGLWKSRSMTPAYWLLWLTIAYYMTLASGPIAQSRYRLPVEGFVFLFALLALPSFPRMRDESSGTPQNK